MTTKEAIAIKLLKNPKKASEYKENPFPTVYKMAIEALEDKEEIAEVLQSDVDAETKCKMISNILSAKPHYFEVEQDLCKNCIFEEGSRYCVEHCPYEAKTEQESCNDAISRQAILDKYKSCADMLSNED